MQHTLCKHTCICTRTCAFAHCFTAVRDAPSRVPMLIVPASTRPRLCRSKQRKRKFAPPLTRRASRQTKRSHRTRSLPRSALATKWLPHHMRMLRGNARITAPCHWASISASSVASPNHQNFGRSRQASEVSTSGQRSNHRELSGLVIHSRTGTVEVDIHTLPRHSLRPPLPPIAQLRDHRLRLAELTMLERRDSSSRAAAHAAPIGWSSCALS